MQTIRIKIQTSIPKPFKFEKLEFPKSAGDRKAVVL